MRRPRLRFDGPTPGWRLRAGYFRQTALTLASTQGRVALARGMSLGPTR